MNVSTVKSFCRFCHAFCGVELDVADGRIVALRGDPDNPVSRGYTCRKGRAEVERLEHPDRLLAARWRDGDELVPMGTSEVLDRVADRLAGIVAEHGPNAVAAYVGCGGHRSAAGGPWFVRRWLDGLGSSRMYTNFTIDSPSMIVAATRMFGSPVPLVLFDIDRADVALMVGTNPTTSHFMTLPQPDPRRRLADARRRGMQLVVIDPRRTEVAQMADLHLQVRPGEDAALLAGMARTILTEGLHDREFVARHASGVDELAAAVAPFEPALVQRRTGIAPAAVEEAARRFATAARGGAVSGTGVHMGPSQTLTTQLVMVLNVLCGRYDRLGGLTHHAGALNTPIPEFTEPLGPIRYDPPRSRIRDIPGSFNWLGFFEELPTGTLTDEILTPGDGQVRALIVHGGNPALAFPDADGTAKALESLDLLVVNDLFLTPTARRAHAVLPMAHPFERPDLPRLADAQFPVPFSMYTPAVVPRPDEALEDWEPFWELAHRMGFDIDLPGLPEDRRPTTDDVLEALHRDARIPLSEIRRHPGGAVFEPSEPLVGRILGTMVGHAANPIALGHPELLRDLTEALDEPDEDLPLRLITYRMKDVYCTQGQNLPSLARHAPRNPALVHPDTLGAEGLADGDRVLLDSGFGQVEAVVSASDEVGPGTVACAFGWGPDDGGANVQHLIPDDERYDPVSGQALQSAIPIRLVGLGPPPG
jgi:anaerobic selenocysteine-containing dehydrogenase